MVPKKKEKTLHIYFEIGSNFIFVIIPLPYSKNFSFVHVCKWIKTNKPRSLASFLDRESSNNTKGSTIILIVTQQYLSQRSFRFQRN